MWQIPINKKSSLSRRKQKWEPLKIQRTDKPDASIFHNYIVKVPMTRPYLAI